MTASAWPQQTLRKEVALDSGAKVEVRNLYGRVSVEAVKHPDGDRPSAKLELVSDKPVSDSEYKLAGSGGRLVIEIAPTDADRRIDIRLSVPERVQLRVETAEGEIDVAGNFASVEAVTTTGTIAADVPDDEIKYDLLWTTSRPRYVADFELEEVKERAAGKFTIKGRYPKDTEKEKKGDRKDSTPQNADDAATAADGTVDASSDSQNGEKKQSKPTKAERRAQKRAARDAEESKRTDVELKFTTARGIVMLNVPPNEIASDLRERPLTSAAKSIIRSGDSLLMDAIRRASPKYFGEYMRTLPPAKLEPSFGTRRTATDNAARATTKRVLVSAFDIGNRTITGLEAKDFEVTENGEPREVVSVEPTTAPFNLVLVLDVSGSVENYVDFIRKAARAFIDTVGPHDRVALVTFNEDVHLLSGFTTDKAKLSASLDSFDAGGGTAYYDALAYTLADTLRSIRGERSAVVVLTDGNDNRSFLSFDSLMGSIQESGALFYPLYVPSRLIAASAGYDPDKSIDAMRQKYMGLTARAEGEGEKLAQISGGMYYPITQISQIQTAYQDIVRQLRTAYSVTFRSQTADNTASERRASPRLKVRVKRENAFVKLGSVVAVDGK